MAREMRHSGIEWIGEIPKGWDILPFKQMYELGKGLSITKADLVEEGVPVISYGQIHSKSNSGTTIKDELIRFVPNTFLEGNSSSLVKKGDVIFADTSEDLDGCGNCIYIDRDSVMFAGYHTIIAKYLSFSPNNYLSYLFKTDCWRSQIRSSVNGVKLFSVPQRLLGSTTIIVPPLSEQQKIANYLDKVCGEVDEMIALQEQMIEELKAYKQSVITEAVTKGLNPDAPMKDSGIDWIGKVPEGWNVAKLKYYIKVDSGDAITNEQLGETGSYPVYGGGEIMGYYSSYNTDDEALIVGRVGARCGCVTLTEGKSWATDNALIVKTDWQLKYVFYLLQGANLNRLNTSNAQPLITATKIKTSMFRL